ncbi:methionyl-tRNA formyltransferase [Thalassoglobus polymorphus]|uniref:Methionyl-tRNA formyltransferase n=1 Tax=Thalassoglobus polymorphus TaxID=2527994 RepID=A0A517QJD3_9PLAN|nr:methionyl-tRNA formyltransferase [Thalassoglobus polymorphus]QDT31704.1 Methionyl-tRNA formyltransferase [Thalassoglobus polymorphus]
MSLRVVMMGTGTFALPAFQALIDSDHDVVGLVTQPDRVGRGHHNHVNEMKEAALAGGVEVFQPANVNTEESLQQLDKFQADIFVVAAYGQILSSELLDIPRLGAINLHGSLLPKYRGAAPVQFAVLNGETESGVTIFQIEPKLDAGPILGVVKTDIGPKETSGELHDRMAELSAPLTLEVLDGLESGNIEHLKQEPTEVTRAPKIRKEHGAIDWSMRSDELGWHVRGMQPWPMAFTFLHLPEKKSTRILILDIVELSEDEAASMQNLQPGETSQVEKRIFVRTGNGAVEILKLQPSGKRPMSAAEFLNGTSVQSGKFGPESL